ncbi:MAG: hypothetical protein DWQ01_00655 [Planctomycetota bacterium]|nr:MAG: hypothetical protein DWQ01_00655 [Planctomycetota bacterium]
MGLWKRLFGSKPQSTPAAGRSLEDTRQSGYWQCQGCGSIHFKQEGLEVLAELQDLGNEVSGGSTCSECGTRHRVAEIASGKFDMQDSDELIAKALADPGNASWDRQRKQWSYRGKPLRGSTGFGTEKPRQLDVSRSSDGTPLFFTVHVGKEAVLHQDLAVVDEITGSVAEEVRNRGVVVPSMLFFSGFDHDSRPIWKIQEIRSWCRLAFERAPHLLTLLTEQTVDPVSWSLIETGEVQEDGAGNCTTAIDPMEWLQLLKESALACGEFLRELGMQEGDDWVEQWFLKRCSHVKENTQ